MVMLLPMYMTSMWGYQIDVPTYLPTYLPTVSNNIAWPLSNHASLAKSLSCE